MSHGRSTYNLMLPDRLMATVKLIAIKERKWPPNVVAALLREALAARGAK